MAVRTLVHTAVGDHTPVIPLMTANVFWRSSRFNREQVSVFLTGLYPGILVFADVAVLIWASVYVYKRWR